MDKNINTYICHTPYHLLIAITKTLKDHNSDITDLIICNSEVIGSDVIERVRANNIFRNITVHKDIDSECKCIRYCNTINPFSRIRSVRYSWPELLDVEKINNSNVYIFNDLSAYGIYMNVHKIYYHLLEDGLDCYKSDRFVRKFSPLHFATLLCYSLFGVYSQAFGESKYTIDIEVNEKKGTHFRNYANVKGVSRKDLMEQLDDNEKNIIVNTFIGDNKIELVQKDSNACLVLTQPLSEDGIVSEKQQIAIYHEIIDKLNAYNVYIKIHPREEEKLYKENFPTCTIFAQKNMPIEVISMIPHVYFQKAITIYSTAINTINFVDEKIVLGREWMDSVLDTMIS